MHEHAIFLGYAVEHCKATIAAKVHIKRLEDLGSEVSERVTKDTGYGLLKQCLSFLQAGQTACKAAGHILATEVPTEELGEKQNDPVNCVFDISLGSALSGLDLMSTADLIKFICASIITSYKKDIEANLKTTCAGFLQQPWHDGLPADKVLSPEAETAILEKGAELQSKVKGKVLLPYLNELDKDRAKSISVSLFISTVEVSLLCFQDLDLTLYIVHYIVIYILYTLHTCHVCTLYTLFVLSWWFSVLATHSFPGASVCMPSQYCHHYVMSLWRFVCVICT